MHRRNFLQLAAATPLCAAPTVGVEPAYKKVTPYPAQSSSIGMPGKYPGVAVRTHSAASIEEGTGKVNPDAVREMLARGMVGLTGQRTAKDAWASFFAPSDVVGIKVNCSGAPGVMSTPAVVAGVVENLIAVGVKPDQIWIYERFPDQLSSAHYDRFVPAGVHIDAIEKSRRSIINYDPKTYVEVDFFGEDDTRSNMVRHVTERFTKIINVPNMKDHGAAGVTGCLKNIAYGNYSNVARSHYREKTNTLSFIGTLASMEPLRSKTVLQVMDGLRGIWHGGPFAKSPRFYFYPKQIVFGTDPVALDRLLIDIIDDKRKAEGAISVWERSMQYVKQRGGELDPNVNRFIREPGHIEYASKLGLGVYDIQKIQLKTIEV
ncbi:MAG: DUF362 domain-containing protein [Acidobacteriaceae bacterium]|nr:DUF362 domain-containing protein [Acidobacteriaceae bacterium]